MKIAMDETLEVVEELEVAEVEAVETVDEAAEASEMESCNDRADDDQDAESPNGLADGQIALIGVENEDDDPKPPDTAKTPGDVARDRFRSNLSDAQSYYVDCSIRRANCEVELKALKKEEKEALAAVESLINRGPVSMPLLDRAEAQAVEGQAAQGQVEAAEQPEVAEQPEGQAGEGEGNDPATPATSTNTDNSWRFVDVEHLGLRPILTEKLRESDINTIGQLEDLRAKGFGKDIGLQSIKGIGKNKADEIEDAVINWLSKHRDAEVLEAAGGRDGNGEGN